MASSPRSCPLCPRTRMRPHLRHLHELAPGSRFRFEGSSRIGTLLRTTPSRAVVAYDVEPAAVAFETRFGGPVAFLATPSREQSCTVGAEVVPA